MTVSLLLILLCQVVLGTQVREQVDEVSKSLQYGQRELWIGRLDKLFYFHRSFSWLVLLGAVILCWRAWPYSTLKKYSLYILGLVILTGLLGIIMNYYAVPALAQPLHLLMASILVIAVFAFRLRLK